MYIEKTSANVVILIIQNPKQVAKCKTYFSKKTTIIKNSLH